MEGVWPWPLRAEMSASISCNSSMQSVCPPCAARCMGCVPSTLGWETAGRAPRRQRRRRVAALPSRHAPCRGVFPRVSPTVSFFTPHAYSASTTLSKPWMHARCSGVLPPRHGAERDFFAPHSASARITPGWPSLAAKCAGVRPLLAVGWLSVCPAPQSRMKKTKRTTHGSSSHAITRWMGRNPGCGATDSCESSSTPPSSTISRTASSRPCIAAMKRAFKPSLFGVDSETPLACRFRMAAQLPSMAA
eukprot:2109256-Rhodomonas_salina.2